MNNSRDIANWMSLTPMARAIAVLVRDDRLDKEIAEMLKLSPEGVRYHMRALRKKFACRSRVGVAVAVERVAHTLPKTASMQSAQTVENSRPHD